MDSRVVWIDWAKVVGIAFVVYAHLPVPVLKWDVFLFHMPFWFIISGYL